MIKNVDTYSLINLTFSDWKIVTEIITLIARCYKFVKCDYRWKTTNHLKEHINGADEDTSVNTKIKWYILPKKGKFP